MSKIDLLIDTTDEIYGKNLGKALALKDSLFSPSYGDMLTKLDQGEKISLLLTDKIVSAEAAGKSGTVLVFLNHNPLENIGCPGVFIYGGLEEIAEKIYRTLEMEKGYKITRFSPNRSKLLGVLSGAGGVGCTAIAIGLGKELALNFGYKALYISFENIPSTSLYFQDLGGRATINEYIYHCFKNEKTRPVAGLEAYLIDDLQGLKAFRPADMDNQVLSLSKDELSGFLGDLVFTGGYDFIILDMPGALPLLSSELLESCYRLVLVDDGRPLSLYKNKKWLGKWERDPDKTLEVTNKWEAGLEIFEKDGNDRIVIEYDPLSFEELEGEDGSEFAYGYLKIGINTRFGLGIRRLADELTKDL